MTCPRPDWRTDLVITWPVCLRPPCLRPPCRPGSCHRSIGFGMYLDTIFRPTSAPFGAHAAAVEASSGLIRLHMGSLGFILAPWWPPLHSFWFAKISLGVLWTRVGLALSSTWHPPGAHWCFFDHIWDRSMPDWNPNHHFSSPGPVGAYQGQLGLF